MIRHLRSEMLACWMNAHEVHKSAEIRTSGGLFFEIAILALIGYLVLKFGPVFWNGLSRLTFSWWQWILVWIVPSFGFFSLAALIQWINPPDRSYKKH